MFEQFSDLAIESIFRAQETARRFLSDRIQDEHILIGLIGDGTGPVPVILGSVGLESSQILLTVERILDRGDTVHGHIQFGIQGQQAIEQAWLECKKLQQEIINTGHILLGVLSVKRGVVARALQILNVDSNLIVARTVEALKEDSSGDHWIEAPPDRHLPLDVLSSLNSQTFLALTIAEQEARRAGHEFIGSEHILLGALQLMTQKELVNIDRIRSEIDSITGCGSGWMPRRLGFTPSAVKILRSALAYGDGTISLEHVLAALNEKKHGISARVISKLGIQLIQ